MVEIRPIQPDQIDEVKQVILAVCQELFQVSEAVIQRYDDFPDIDNVRAHYFENNGMFLVLMNDGRVVGSGAIRHLDDDTCELKRMFFLKDYRGRGLGKKLLQMLLAFAREAGYRRVRLDTLDAQKQAQALKLYNRHGFYPIERYNDSSATVFMEKML